MEDTSRRSPISAVYRAIGGFVGFCRTWFSVPAVLLCAAVCAVAFLSSCEPCARLSRRCPPVASETLTVHDSIHVTDTVYMHDTLREVKLVPGEASAVGYATDTVKVETQYATATAYVSAGTIVAHIRNKDSALALVTETERLRSLVRFHSQRAEKVEVKREIYVPVVVKWLAGTGAATLLALLIWAILAIARRLR